MSSQIEIVSNDPHIISGHTLSFRENAELTKYCSLLVGCSSGITWLATSDWAKPLPMIQLLRKDKGVYASVVHDHEHFGLAGGDLILAGDGELHGLGGRLDRLDDSVESFGGEEAEVGRGQRHPMDEVRRHIADVERLSGAQNGGGGDGAGGNAAEDGASVELHGFLRFVGGLRRHCSWKS